MPLCLKNSPSRSTLLYFCIVEVERERPKERERERERERETIEVGSQLASFPGSPMCTSETFRECTWGEPGNEPRSQLSEL